MAGSSDDKAAAVALKNSLKELKLRPMNCAVAQVGKASEILFDKLRKGPALMAELKETHDKIGKITSGTAWIAPENDEEVILDLKQQPASGTCKRLARRFRVAGLRVVTLRVEGQFVESERDDVEDGESAAADVEAAGEKKASLTDRVKAALTAPNSFPAHDPRRAAVDKLRNLIHEKLVARELPTPGEIGALEQLVSTMPAAAPAAPQPEPEPVAGPSSKRSVRTPADIFAATLRGGASELMAARGLPGAAGSALPGLVQQMTQAKAGGEFEQASELARQARRTSISLLGKARVTREQGALHDRMAPVFQKVETGSFTDASIKALGKLNPGTHFKRFIEAQKKFRKVFPDAMDKKGDKRAVRTEAEYAAGAGACDEITAAAQSYLVHFAKLGDARGASAEMQAKKANAESALTAARHMKLAMEYGQLGNPSWDADKSLRATGIEARFAFETGRLIDMSDRAIPKNERQGRAGSEGLVQRPAPTLADDAGVSAAFWVESFDPAANAGDVGGTGRALLFKPAAGEVDGVIAGFSGGGSAPREALTYAMSEALLGMINLDLGCPRTSLATVSSDKIDVAGYNAALAALQAKEKAENKKAHAESRMLDKEAPALTGSLQQVIGPVSKLPAPNQAPCITTYDDIAPETCQQMAVLDILTLNLDRHRGNILVQNDPAGGAQRLVPIDHGLTLPNELGLSNAESRMNNPEHNILLAMPGTFQPFSEEVMQRLELIDPDRLRNEMTRTRDSLAAAHPTLEVGQNVADKSIDIAVRSATLLKWAARKLSAGVIQLMIAAEQEMLLLADDVAFKEEAMSKINAYVKQAEALKGLYREHAGDLEALGAELRARDPGLQKRGASFRTWLAQNANTARDLLAAPALMAA